MTSFPAERPIFPSLETVRSLIDHVTCPQHFFVAPDLALVWQPPGAEEISWEVFRGRLLDAAQTRQVRCFTAWNIFQKDGDTQSAEPLLSVKLDEGAAQVHVVRAIYCHVWEGFDAGASVMQSRETRKWVRELVGTISLGAFAGPDDVRHELTVLIGAAVAGTSRLPLNSVEAPLPAFSLGRIAYLPSCAGVTA